MSVVGESREGFLGDQLIDSAGVSPESAAFVLVSFEGPDAYSSAGGLGVRVTSLAVSLADHGYETHLFFIGDPNLPGEERRQDGRLVLHRWSQWISAKAPAGVYDAEEAKVRDVVNSLPDYAARHVIRPIIESGRVAVVLSEEWQTASFAIALSDRLHELGLRERSLLFWNANNPYSFDVIDWPRLAFTNTITAVSRYMRSIIRSRGVDALVVPNGIPLRLTQRSRDNDALALRENARGRAIFFKMARWEREKGWTQSLDALLSLRQRGKQATLVARSGGPVGSGSGLREEAEARSLHSEELHHDGDALPALARLIQNGTDVVSLRFGVTERLAGTLFAASDGVLANSVSEPFGLVGLEAMAAGGLVFTGGTGEDYAVSGHNAIVLETLDPNEIADRSGELMDAPALAMRLRRAARRTAREFTWESILHLLLERVEDRARRQGIRWQPPRRSHQISLPPSMAVRSTTRGPRRATHG